MIAPMTGDAWHEAGEGVFRKRFDPCDVTVTAVVGSDGVAVVDTRCSLAEAREVKEQIRRLTAAPIRWVVNTHAHFDHTWGNAEFAAPRLVPAARIWAHESVAAKLDRDDPAVAAFLDRLTAEGPEWAAKVAELELAPPTETVRRLATIDLGDRWLELRFLGRGHTEGDLWIRILGPGTGTGAGREEDVGAFTGIALAGDLVEQSGPPALGPDSFPLEWAATLERALELTGEGALVIPGHGEPVDAGFIREQLAAIDSVAREIRSLHAAGVRAADALAEGNWPFPAEGLRDAVVRGYTALGEAAPG